MTPMTIKDRIIAAARDNDPYNHSHDDAILAAARTALEVAKEMYQQRSLQRPFSFDDLIASLVGEQLVEKKDVSAALLPVDPSAPVNTGALPDDWRYVHSILKGLIAEVEGWQTTDRYQVGAKTQRLINLRYVQDLLIRLEPQSATGALPNFRAALEDLVGATAERSDAFNDRLLVVPRSAYQEAVNTLIGSGTQAPQEHAEAPRRSAAP